MGTVGLQRVYSLGAKFFFDSSFSVLVQQSRTTTTHLASLSRSHFGSRSFGVGAPLLSGDVLDEPARSVADLGTGGYDVEPPEVQGTTRSRTKR